MSDKDINIHIRAKDTEQTKRKLDQVADSTKKVGDKSREGAHGVDELNKSASKSSGLFRKIRSSIMGMVAGVASIQAVTAAVKAQTRALEENAQAAQKHQNALLRLQFLGDYYAERPGLRKEVAALAEYGRRPFEEVADAAYNLRSKNAAMTEDQRMGIMREALEMGRTDPSLPLDTLVDMFSLYAKQSGTADANQIQNVLQQTITEAGGSGADVASYMPRFLPIGMAGGLTASESAGLWAYGTTQEAEPSIATTGLRAIMMGLQGKGTPEGAKLLEKMGVTQDMGFFDKINVLSRQNIDLATAELLFQREGASMGLNMLRNPAAMMRTIRSVTGADRADVDLTRSKIEGLFGTDATAKAEENLRLLETQIENIRANKTDALEYKKFKLEKEKAMRGLDVPEWIIQRRLFLMNLSEGLGMSPESNYQWNFPKGERKQIDQYLKEHPLQPAGSPNITFDNSVHYHRNERPAETRTKNLPY